MSKIPIDFVAPPFAGHAFPLLELADKLRQHGTFDPRILSTRELGEASEISGIPFVPLLQEHSSRVLTIANWPHRIGSNPFALYRQLRENLSLLRPLRSELAAIWNRSRPALVIADFTLPTAGHLARDMGIPWWTSLPTPCVFETGDGTPSYCGGWSPSKRTIGRVRDLLGRATTRLFKESMRLVLRRELQALGLNRIYDSDGYESIYSRDTVLALGIEEFEFPRSWPSWFVFSGPLTASPSFPHEPPVFESGKRHILVSLGTHLWWAKTSVPRLLKAVSSHLPDTIFHFSQGRPAGDSGTIDGNVHLYPYLPYDQYMHRYDATISHAGTGVLYSALSNGIPTLAWPHDFDQFDHTARLVQNGLGLRCRPRADLVAFDLRFLLKNEEIRANLARFRERIRSADAVRTVISRLGTLFPPSADSR